MTRIRLSSNTNIFPFKQVLNNGLMVLGRSIVAIVLLLLVFASYSPAQTAANFQTILITGAGRPIAGASVAVCQGTATTAASVSSNVATLTMNSNPIAAGFQLQGTIVVYNFSGADAYFNGTYTITSLSSTQITYSLTHANASATSNGNVVQQGATSATACLPLATLYTDATGSNTAANPTVSDGLGNVSVFLASGVYQLQYYGSNVITTIKEIVVGGGSSSAVIFAENYPNVQAAINACPAAGCVIWATSPLANTTLGNLDAGTKAVTLYLGPFTYSIGTITLEPNFHILGTGDTGATILQANGTTAPIFVINTTTGTGIAGVEIGDMRLYCGAGNVSQTAISVVAPTSGGLWYSQLHDLNIGGNGTNACGGNSVLLQANGGGLSINQWLTFTNVFAFRTTGGAPALRLTGINGQMNFTNTQWDGPTPHDSGFINIQIDDGTSTVVGPYTLVFNNVTSQHAWGANGTGMVIKGCTNCTIIDGHFEDDNGGYQVAIGAHFSNTGIEILQNVFTTNTGSDGGNGFILKADATSRVNFQDNAVFGTPDACITGTPTLVTSRGTMNNSSGAPNTACDNFGVNRQIFTSSGTFTIPSIVGKLKVIIVAGGGAGGGGTATNNGAGGGSGGITEIWLFNTVPGGTIAVTVGAGGAGVSGANGGAGSNSQIASGTFALPASPVTALGGNGGFSLGATSPGAGGIGIGSNGDIMQGGNGGVLGTGGVGGSGAGSPFGGSGGGAGSGGLGGNAATGFGAGGGGGSAGSNNIGGAGSPGIVIFEWVN